MNGTPIGYRSRIRRKWPRKVLVVLIIALLGYSVFFVITDFNTIKEFLISFNNQKSTITELISSPDNIPKQKVDKSDSVNTESIAFKEQKESDVIVFKAVNEQVQTNKPELLKRSEPEVKETDEIVNLTQSNVFDESEHKVTNIVNAEIEPPATDIKLLSVSEDKIKTDTESEQNNSKIVKENYFVIVGSVASKEAAEEQQNKFLGMSEKTDIIFESTNNRYRISLGCYSGFKEASARSKAFQAKHPSYKTWIWKTVPPSVE